MYPYLWTHLKMHHIIQRNLRPVLDKRSLFSKQVVQESETETGLHEIGSGYHYRTGMIGVAAPRARDRLATARDVAWASPPPQPTAPCARSCRGAEH